MAYSDWTGADKWKIATVDTSVLTTADLSDGPPPDLLTFEGDGKGGADCVLKRKHIVSVLPPVTLEIVWATGCTFVRARGGQPESVDVNHPILGTFKVKPIDGGKLECEKKDGGGPTGAAWTAEENGI